MDGQVVDGKRYRNLREQAGLHRSELAALIGCSVGHLKNVEIGVVGSAFAARNQLSAVLRHRSARVFTQKLGTPVSVDDFTVTAAGTAEGTAEGEAA